MLIVVLELLFTQDSSNGAQCQVSSHISHIVHQSNKQEATRFFLFLNISRRLQDILESNQFFLSIDAFSPQTLVMASNWVVIIVVLELMISQESMYHGAVPGIVSFISCARLISRRLQDIQNQISSFNRSMQSQSETLV